MARDATNVGVYRDQLAELDSDLRSDILTREQYEQSKRELQQRMLQDLPQEERIMDCLRELGGKRNVATITLTTLAMPCWRFPSISGWAIQKRCCRSRLRAGPDVRGGSGHPNFSSVLQNLIARFKDQPNDMEGWLMLGRTYAMMQRFNEAKEAYEKVLALAPENPEVHHGLCGHRGDDE